MSHMYKHHHHHHYYCQRQNAEETTAHVQNISPHVTHNVDPFTSNTTKPRNVDLSTENTFQHQENAHKRKSFYLPSTFVLHEFSTWPLIDLDTTNVFFFKQSPTWCPKMPYFFVHTIQHIRTVAWQTCSVQWKIHSYTYIATFNVQCSPAQSQFDNKPVHCFFFFF